MKKMDEMEKAIYLHAMVWGYRTAVLLLSAWTLYNCWRTLALGAEYQPLPGLILCLSVSVQSFYQLAVRQKMVSGDSEYREPNRFLRAVLMTVILTALLLWLGVCLTLTR